MSPLSVFSLLETATRVLSGVSYQSIGNKFIVLHQNVQKHDKFLNSSLVSSYHHLASNLKTFILQRQKKFQDSDSILTYLSVSDDQMFKFAYIKNDVEKEKIEKNLLDYITFTYSSSIRSISKHQKNKNRAINLLLHDFFSSVGTSKSHYGFLENKIIRWFSTLTFFS